MQTAIIPTCKALSPRLQGRRSNDRTGPCLDAHLCRLVAWNLSATAAGRVSLCILLLHGFEFDWST